MTEPLRRRTVRLYGDLRPTGDVQAAIGGHLASIAQSLELVGRDDWKGADIRIRRTYDQNYLTDQIEITLEER